MKNLRLSLRTKIIVSTFIYVLLTLLFFYIVANTYLLSGFSRVEKENMDNSVSSAVAYLREKQADLDQKLSDWSLWDDTYKFVQDKNQAYVDSNLGEATLQNLDINSMYFIATSGAIVYQENVNLQKGVDVNAAKDVEAVMSQPNRVSRELGNKSSKFAAIIKTTEGPYMIVSRPILRTDGSGPAMGTLVFGKYIDSSVIKGIDDVVGKNVSFINYDLTLVDSINPKQNLKQGGIYITDDGNNVINGYALINDFNDNPVYLLKVSSARMVYTEGRNAANTFIIIYAFISLVSLIFAIFVTDKFSTSKIIKLEKQVEDVGDPKTSQKRVQIGGNDEYSDLSEKINDMLDQISKSSEDLEKFKLAIEDSSDHIIITDPDGKITYANKAAERLTGYSFSDMEGNTPRIWGQQMPKEFYEKLWDTIKNKKQPFKGRLTNKRKTGELYPVESTISPIVNDKGEVIFFIGVERDILMEQKLADRYAKENEIIAQQVKEQLKVINTDKARFSASINSLRLGFVMFDKDGWILFSNRSFDRLLGLDNKLKDIKVIDGVLGNELRLKEKFDQCIENAQPLEVRETSFKDKFLRLFFAPIFSTDNSFEIIGVVLVIEDITERKIIERSRDEFFSIASHELRTPLTAIRGNTSLIEQYYKDKLADNDLKQMIDDIHLSSTRLIEIVNEFLNMSRLEMGRMVFKKDVINPIEIAKSVVNDYQSMASEKKLYLQFIEPSEPTPQVVGDRDRVREIIVNLIGNAIKYTEHGGITLSVEVQGNFVKIAVNDTGRGVTPENKQLLFRKFQQATSSIYTRDALKGTGLGLYISKLMSEGMNGKVELDKTEVGKGSTFSLSLPILSGN